MKRVWAVASAMCCLAGSVGADLVLRTGSVIDAPIEGVSLDGVAIGGAAPRVLGWDAVYFARGEGAEEVEVYRDWSDDVWRAKSRLMRGDLELASPLFDELFARLMRDGVAGPTGLVIAEGALRCRVWENRHSDAIEAWAAALRIRETGQRQSGESGAAGVIDARTLLVPTLPPMWLEGSAAAVQVHESLERSGGSESSQAILNLYRVCAGHDAGRDVEWSLEAGRFGEGYEFVDTIIRARDSDARTRSAARAQLTGIIKEKSGTWQEAWARAALGRSLLMEESREERDRGVLHLLHVPARFARAQPHLAAVSLAEAGRALHRHGDHESVSQILLELRNRYPQHGAADWLEAAISQ